MVLGISGSYSWFLLSWRVYKVLSYLRFQHNPNESLWDSITSENPSYTPNTIYTFLEIHFLYTFLEIQYFYIILQLQSICYNYIKMKFCLSVTCTNLHWCTDLHEILYTCVSWTRWQIYFRSSELTLLLSNFIFFSKCISIDIHKILHIFVLRTRIGHRSIPGTASVLCVANNF